MTCSVSVADIAVSARFDPQQRISTLNANWMTVHAMTVGFQMQLPVEVVFGDSGHSTHVSFSLRLPSRMDVDVILRTDWFLTTSEVII